MAVNYDDVMRQLGEAGLLIDHLDIGRMRRCKVEGDSEKRGWYAVHEITLDGGDVVLVGSYGVWRGDDNGAMKIDLQKRQLSADQKAAIKARLAEDAKRAKADREADQRAAADRAAAKWAKLESSGDIDYLSRKGIAAHGVRFGGAGTTIDGETDSGRPWATDAAGAMFIPMMDTQCRTHGLQVIWLLLPAEN